MQEKGEEKGEGGGWQEETEIETKREAKKEDRVKQGDEEGREGGEGQRGESKSQTKQDWKQARSEKDGMRRMRKKRRGGREEEETEEGKWKTRRRAMWSREDEKGEWKSQGSEGSVMDWWTRSKNKGEKRGSMKRSFARRIQTQRMERREEGEVWWWGRERRMEPRIEASGVAVRKLNWNEPASNQTKNKLIRWGILLTPASPHSQFQGTWFWSVIEWSSSITETWNAICIITSVLFGFLLERTERWPDNPALQDTTSL